ncbi:MAG: peroxide stress protein YaaA [Saprospiraceae bacterium]
MPPNQFTYNGTFTFTYDMIALLSPAKTLDETPVHGIQYTLPRLLPKSGQLIGALRKKSVGDLQELMHISEKLAVQNKERYRHYSEPFTPENAKPAALLFKGDVYTGLEAETFSQEEMTFAQAHIRILSGLYGLLRPLDLIHPYRLEMGTALSWRSHKNLYSFWGTTITQLLNDDLAAHPSPTVVNLASQEYFQAIQPHQLKARLLHIHFKEERGGVLKVISFNAKKARGKMAQLIVREQLEKPEDLQQLVVDDYVFRPNLSDESNWIFVKEAL